MTITGFLKMAEGQLNPSEQGRREREGSKAGKKEGKKEGEKGGKGGKGRRAGTPSVFGRLVLRLLLQCCAPFVPAPLHGGLLFLAAGGPGRNLPGSVGTNFGVLGGCAKLRGHRLLPLEPILP